MGFLQNLSASSAKINKTEDRCKKMVQLAFEKVAGHYTNAAQYPLPASDTTIERAMYNLLNAAPRRKRDKFIEQYSAHLGKTTAQRQAIYGALASVNLHLATAVADQLVNIPVTETDKLTKAEADELLAHIRKEAVPLRPRPAQRAKAVATAAPAQTVPVIASFVVESFTCNKTSEIRKDELSLAGFGIGPVGAQQNVAPFFLGEFRKEDTIAVPAANATLFNLEFDQTSAASFPQTFAASLFLIEKDWIHNRELSNKLSIACFAIYGACMVAVGVIITVGVLGGPATPAMAYLALAIGLTFLIIGLQLLPLITDDVSSVVTDTLVVDALPVAGEQFARTMNFTLLNLRGDITPGKYTAAVRWEIRNG